MPFGPLGASTPPASGDYWRYDGTRWNNSALLTSDLAAITTAVVWNVASTNFTNSVFFNQTVTCYNTLTCNLSVTFASNSHLQMDSAGSGNKIGTSAAQKIGFWNATPIVQPTTAVTAAAFVANTSGIADDTATWGGYTGGKIVAALKAAGLLA
jgi:hypothetical protein